MSLSFSIVINTYNRAASLANTLAAMRFLHHPRFEVVVVPGPCTDDTDAVLARFAGGIRVARCGDRNLSHSRNIGIEHASGDIIAFIDDDGIPEPNWLDAIEAVYRKSPRAGAVGGFVRDHTGVAYQAKYILCNRGGDAQFFDKRPAHYVSRPGLEWYPSLIGVNSSFRREALLEVGGFDEEYAYFLDETDLCLRIIESGWEIHLAEDAEVHHKFAPSHLRSEKKVPTSLLPTTRSKVYYQFRHHMPGLADPFERAQQVRANIHRDISMYALGNYVTPEQRKSLDNDVEIGWAEGVRDAHATPQGKVRPDLKRLPRPELLPHPVTVPAGERVRLILVSQGYPPKPIGGVGVFIVNLAKALARMGHEVAVITQADEVHTVDFEEGVWVHRVPVKAHPSDRKPELPDVPPAVANWAYTVLDEAMRIQAQRGASHVLGAIWDLETLAVTASGAFQTFLYLVTTYALSLPSKPDWQANEHFRIHHVEKVIAGEKWITERATRVMASTLGILRDVEASYDGLDIPPERIRHLPFGLPDHRAAPWPGKPEGVVELLYVGRFEPRKGTDLLLSILPRLLDRHPNLQVRLVGDDRLQVNGRTIKEGFLAEHASHPALDRIHFIGEVDDARLAAEYARCDFFVAPSRYESFGLIYLEAMREEKPVVGCDTGGVPELVTPDVGLLVPPGDAEALLAALDQLAGDADLRWRMGQAGRKRFVEVFHLDRFAEAMIAEIRALPLRTL
jgi:glycosyltransferase involved in cell wall biosynthesis/GT2 family glycosyltransferase